MNITRGVTLLLSIVLGLSIATAQTYTIDISGLKGDEYSIGEDITINVLLLEDGTPTQTEAQITLTDALERKTVERTILTNKETNIRVEPDYPSGLWTITAKAKETTVQRNFVINENQQVTFTIEGDELIITNTGNTRYTRTITITIGETKNTYAQNIAPGEQKKLKLLSPEGNYDIEVTDGETSIKRENVALFGGTGNVIGAVDEELVGYTGFAGASEIGNRQAPLSKLPVSLTFIAAVFILGILVFTERKLTKNRKRK